MIDAAILVGGIGSRLGKITKNTPKPLIKIDKKRFLDYLLAKLSKYNFRKIYLLCSYKKHLFFNLYNNKIMKKHNRTILQSIKKDFVKGFRRLFWFSYSNIKNLSNDVPKKDFITWHNTEKYRIRDAKKLL